MVGRHLDWGALADRTTDLEVIRGESLDLGQESHLEVAIFVDFEELLETFDANQSLEHRLERVVLAWMQHALV